MATHPSTNRPRADLAGRADIDLDDTTGCPRTDSCEVCGSTADVSSRTVGTRDGVACLRVCLWCADPSGPPPFDSRADARQRIGEHCGHLGISYPQMVAVLQVEGVRP